MGREEGVCASACTCAGAKKKGEIKIAPLPIKKPNYHSQSAVERHKERLSYNGSVV